VLAALGIGAYFLFSGGSAGAATPTAAVRQLLDAAKRGDVPAAERALCAADQNQEVLADLRSAGRLSSYSIVSAKQTDGRHAVVRARVTFALFPQPQSLTTPVVKEGGAWKVCPTYSSQSGSGGGTQPSAAPTLGVPPSGAPAPSGFPSVSIPPIAIPSLSVPSGIPGFNPCAFTSGDALRAATTYVGLAELGETSVAQACVYHDAVPRSVTASLHVAGPGSYFAPSGHSGATFDFAAIDGSAHLSVTVTKEPDGRFYVTKVVKR
jgi:hypothetical protein